MSQVYMQVNVFLQKTILKSSKYSSCAACTELYFVMWVSAFDELSKWAVTRRTTCRDQTDAKDAQFFFPVESHLFPCVSGQTQNAANIRIMTRIRHSKYYLCALLCEACEKAQFVRRSSPWESSMQLYPAENWYCPLANSTNASLMIEGETLSCKRKQKEDVGGRNLQFQSCKELKGFSLISVFCQFLS